MIRKMGALTQLSTESVVKMKSFLLLRVKQMGNKKFTVKKVSKII